MQNLIAYILIVDSGGILSLSFLVLLIRVFNFYLCRGKAIMQV